MIYPVVGGEKTLKALTAEAAANEARYKARVRTVLRSSYSAHWRRSSRRCWERTSLRPLSASS
ncbi:hypothetical protein QFZ56_005935 [Streptomyces achromogenes]|uniref:Uncharacterized protein n=1 Tax=Streptomyces achromogenes TaxID=67255 RepID=A0ABU0Q8H9_STRAH|nr:hypothetical protein [Streptomyces achromogenes]MDQ0686972.1 hypothetical protein [Streptomyces achromogenes]